VELDPSVKDPYQADNCTQAVKDCQKNGCNTQGSVKGNQEKDSYDRNTIPDAVSQAGGESKGFMLDPNEDGNAWQQQDNKAGYYGSYGCHRQILFQILNHEEYLWIVAQHGIDRFWTLLFPDTDRVG
jgi:hypothetical protein